MARYTRPVPGDNTTYPNAGPYSGDQWAERSNIQAPIGSDGTTSGYKYSRGVWPSYLNRLFVSYSGVIVSIGTGAGEVNGHLLINDASVSMTADTPAGNPRIDRVVLAYNNTNGAINTSPAAATYVFQTPDGTDSIPAYTCEIIILKGIENAAPVAPTLEQDAARLFMIPLAQYQISVVPAISSFADQREFAGIEHIVGVIAADNATIDDGLVIGTAVDSAATFGAAGLGVGIKAKLEDAGGTLQDAGRLVFDWHTPTAGAEQAQFRLYTVATTSQNLSAVITSPDNAGAAGNARGLGSVDLQGYRAGATEVASGIFSTISGGQANTASGDESTVCGGNGNLASVAGSTVCGGLSSTASGTYSFVGGGYGNTASGNNAATVGGIQGSASLYGQVASASGLFAAVGDAQGTIQCVARSQETHGDNTWRTLYLDGAGATQRLTIAASSAWTFDIRIIGITQNAASQWSYGIVGMIERDNANNTTLAASTVTTIFESDANFAAQVVADDVNEALAIQVSDAGSSGAVVRWVATVRMVQVTYP